MAPVTPPNPVINGHLPGGGKTSRPAASKIMANINIRTRSHQRDRPRLVTDRQPQARSVRGGRIPAKPKA